MNGLHGVPVQCAVTLQQSRIRNGGRGERGGEEERGEGRRKSTTTCPMCIADYLKRANITAQLVFR